MDDDTPLRVTPHCPECGRFIVYNGNYFCSGSRDHLCDWGLTDSRRDREVEGDYAVLLREGRIQRVSY